MFEITGDDIASLNDGDLRTLVARLAVAELRAQGCPISGVTAGGNQDAPDGGLDVRVECSSAIATPDFVPCALTGFQVKKPDMPATAIKDEMRPKDVLRPVIRDLAAKSGAYVIVSAQGSVADKPLRERKAAMGAALHDCADAAQLHIDFYDRERLATWANIYPGVAAWIRERAERPLSGWGSIGEWAGAKVSEAAPYLFNDKTCLTDERTREREQLTIGEGIQRLRAGLRTPKQCIRLIGLSGLGKTRLVQALFEDGVGETPLDPSLAVYTDYSVETDPTARDMARQLVLTRQRAILLVDNCNPATHTELARICSEGASQVSLLTVEYDVRDDEPERTEVFRLQSAPPELVAQWIEKTFPNVSQVDGRTIADFSDGNFRVARALAETLGKGETLGKLKSRELFVRIFEQRNQPDQDLLLAAEDLSLLYSVNGEDTGSESELAIIAQLRGVSAGSLYAALVTLRRRGIAQARGRWRAVLPHAIANPLAAFALERIPPDAFNRFTASLTPRMLKSLSRRLGYLHDSPEAQAIVARWMADDGPLGDLSALDEDGLEVVTNVAPVAPEAMLAKIAHELDSPKAMAILNPNAAQRGRWIRLIKALAYNAEMFDRAAALLARFWAAEPENHNTNSAKDAFEELFHLHLSGTQALPEQRRAFIRQMARANDPVQQRMAMRALDALLTAHHFSSSSDFDFGARSRDWGWQPTYNRDVWNWYTDAVDLAVELAPSLDEARVIVAGSVRDVWHIRPCHDALDRAATEFVKTKPWIEGWIAFRAAHRFDSNGMPDDVRERLEAIIQRLKPSDLLHQARAVVLSRASGGWDIADGEADDGDAMRPWHKAAEMARDVGRALAQDAEARREFLIELLVEPQALRAFECGLGLADGADELSIMWIELLAAFAAADTTPRNVPVLGGFIHAAHERDADFAETALEAIMDDPALSGRLPYLQARIAIDIKGIARLRRALARGTLEAWNFDDIANGVVGDAPPEPLSSLLEDISQLAGGVEIALDILHMHFYRDREKGRPHSAALIAIGRSLLQRADFSEKGTFRDYGLRTVIRICCAGVEGVETARQICSEIRGALDAIYISSRDLSHVLSALFETQPFEALDAFLLDRPPERNLRLFRAEVGLDSPIADMDPTVLRQWADRDPTNRYPLLGQCVGMFKCGNGEEENLISPMFLTLLDFAPDKSAYLGDFRDRLHPRSWSGSLAVILRRRKAQLLEFREGQIPEVQQWIDDFMPEVDRWIEHERGRERGGEESFE